ncbi:MAG: nuclear transport factor 2 family protein [SAR202 cluster bacterium]|nr:nuclear transport factor 2 family protein [SAR202 cluster bacterium]
MLDQSFAEHFAADWIDSWNGHDLDRILSHYSDTFEMSSPVIARLVNEPSGSLTGKIAVGEYWAKALELNPGLYFELVNTLVGVNSITLYYKGHRGMSAECFHFGPDQLVVKAFAHYAP